MTDSLSIHIPTNDLSFLLFMTFSFLWMDVGKRRPTLLHAIGQGLIRWCSLELWPWAAKSLQSCLTLCDPIDSSPPGSQPPRDSPGKNTGVVAISFSNAWKWKVNVKLLSHVRLLVTPWTAAHQAPPSMGFSRQEYWSGVPLPSLLALREKPKKKKKLNTPCSMRNLPITKIIYFISLWIAEVGTQQVAFLSQVSLIKQWQSWEQLGWVILFFYVEKSWNSLLWCEIF